jgi:acyl carrier protein
MISKGEYVSMSENHIMPELAEIIRDLLEEPELVVLPETSAANVPSWDSMKHILILMAAQEKFGVQLTTREMDGLRNVGDLAAAITRHLKKDQA